MRVAVSSGADCVGGVGLGEGEVEHEAASACLVACGAGVGGGALSDEAGGAIGRRPVVGGSVG